MAIYHLSMQVIKRSEGKSAIAAAAYRSASRLADKETGRIADYRNKSGVMHSEIIIPDGAPEWMKDRQKLWQAAEAFEVRKDAQLAREMNMALPRELDREKQIALVRAFVSEAFVEKGMVADVSLHDDKDSHNPHAHVMLTMREAWMGGFRKTKTREWNSREFLNTIRASWADAVNAELERLGHDARIDHRTLEAQGITDRDPQIHVGPKAQRLAEIDLPVESRPIEYRTPSNQKRTVDYRKFDTGNRAKWNLAIIMGNRRRYAARMTELEHMLASQRIETHRWAKMKRESSQQFDDAFKAAFRRPGEAKKSFYGLARRQGFDKAFDLLAKRPTQFGGMTGLSLFGRPVGSKRREAVVGLKDLFGVYNARTAAKRHLSFSERVALDIQREWKRAAKRHALESEREQRAAERLRKKRVQAWLRGKPKGRTRRRTIN